MERVILTTLYVATDEKNLIAGRAPDAPPAEVTFAWFPQLDPGNIPDISDGLSTGPKEIKVDLADFLDELLRKGRYAPSVVAIPAPPLNLTLIEKIIHEPIVIERSPPEAISISNLLKLSGSPAALGTYVGIAAANGNYLLLLTVPAGILIVGAAIEVTKAIPKLLGTAAHTSRPRPSKKRNTPPRAAGA